MTDRTQPEVGSTHLIRYALELGLLWIDGSGRDKVRDALAALDALEAKLASIGAGGGLALSAAPAEVQSPWSRALEIRMAQGWKLKGDRVPVLYTDSINGEGVGRDDLWLCTTGALAASPTPPAEQPGTPPAGWLPVHSNGRGFYGGPLKTEDEAKRYISQVEQSNDSVTLIARAFVWADEQQNARPLPLPWPWTEGAQVLNDAINHIDGQDRLKNALRVLASTTYPQAAQTPQQAAPKAAPGESRWWRKRADEIEAQVALTGSPEAMRCYTDMRTLLQAVAEAAPQQEASQDTMYLLRRLLSNQHTLTGPEFRAELEKIVGEAYQQEAQEPALFVSPKQLAALTDPDDPEGEHGRYLPARKTSKGLFTQPLYTAPQPAPAPLGDDVVRDAARYRWLRDECDDVDVKDGLMWIAQSHETLDAAIDAATASRPQ